MKYSKSRIAIRWQTLLLCIVLIGINCSKEKMPESKGEGTLQINLGISVRAFDAYSHLKEAHPDQFRVIIFSIDGTEVISYDSASDVPESIQLPEGEYYVVAHSNNNLPAAFENDYYYGESEVVTIIAGQTQEVEVYCSLANIGVSVVYAATVTRDFSSYETQVSNAIGTLLYDEDEQRTGFFDVGPLAIEATLRYTDGSGANDSIVLNGSIPSADPGTHYEIHIDAELGTGGLGINIHADESADTVIVIISDESSSARLTGEVIITEIMYNPSALPDGGGEYIELYNTTQASINLNGMYLIRGTDDQSHQIGSDVIIGAQQYAVLAISDTATSRVDYVYSSISLVNGGDSLTLSLNPTVGGGDIICLVDYGANGFPSGLNGTSMQLCAEQLNANAALTGNNWSASTAAFSTGDEGSPGEANETCD